MRKSVTQQEINAGSTLLPNGCIVWKRAMNSNGYGVIWHEGRQIGVHRLVYMLAHGDIGSRSVRRTCGNKACISLGCLTLGPEQPSRFGKKNSKNAIYSVDEIVEALDESHSIAEAVGILGASDATIRFRALRWPQIEEAMARCVERGIKERMRQQEWRKEAKGRRREAMAQKRKDRDELVLSLLARGIRPMEVSRITGVNYKTVYRIRAKGEQQ